MRSRYVRYAGSTDHANANIRPLYRVVYVITLPLLYVVILPEVSLPGTVNVTEGDGTVQVCVTLDGPTTEATNLTLSTSNGDGK